MSAPTKRTSKRPPMKRQRAHHGLAELLDAIVEYYRRYTLLPSVSDYDVLALWTAHTYVVMTVWSTTPYLQFSGLSGSGKSFMQRLVKTLALNPITASSPTAAVLYRLANGTPLTLFVDEMDSIWRGDSDHAQIIRSILDMGYERGHSITRLDPLNNYEPMKFDPYCPTSLAGIGDVPETIRLRSIIVPTVETSRFEVEEYKYHEADFIAEPIRQGLVTWANNPDTIPVLQKADWKLIPNTITGQRLANLWLPLAAIADMAGGSWPHKVNNAMLDRYRSDIEVREMQQPDRIFDTALQYALNRGFIRIADQTLTSKDRKSPPIVDNFTAMNNPIEWGWSSHVTPGFINATLWHDDAKRTATIRMRKDDFPGFYAKVRQHVPREQQSLLPVDPVEALRLFREAGRLLTDNNRSLTCKTSLYSGKSQISGVVSLNVDHLCWTSGLTTISNETDSRHQEEIP